MMETCRVDKSLIAIAMEKTLLPGHEPLSGNEVLIVYDAELARLYSGLKAV